MTVERVTFVAIPKQAWEENLASFAQQAERAIARYLKAPPGDRREAVRYESLCRTLERLVSSSVEQNNWLRWDLDDEASRILDRTDEGIRHPWSLSAHALCGALNGDAPTGLAEMDGNEILFELRSAFDRGNTVRTAEPPVESHSQAPFEVWRAPKATKEVFAAIRFRWRDQLAAAAADNMRPLVPSGVNNQILSEGLREFVLAEEGQQRVSARVIYRDGSEAKAFPLRALQMKDAVDSNLRVLRVSLMSMRHPEMDTAVDAAWLRNSHVSLSRPAAETDALVYETSLKQLGELAAGGCVCLRVFQTGFEPAVVGFYRAVTDYLLENPRAIEVAPHFHQRDDSYQEGKPWAMT